MLKSILRFGLSLMKKPMELITPLHILRFGQRHMIRTGSKITVRTILKFGQGQLIMVDILMLPLLRTILKFIQKYAEYAPVESE